MGYSTGYLGRLNILPRHNPQEVEWLPAFGRTHCTFPSAGDPQRW